MSYAPKHAKPTSIMDAVLGRHEPSDPGILPAGRHACHEHGGLPEASAGLAALSVPRPRRSPDEMVPGEMAPGEVAADEVAAGQRQP